MIQKLELLKTAGCDIDGAIERFIDDEEFMLDCIEKVLEDPAFEQLGGELEAGDSQPAFESAHLLKGIIANTGLTPLYNIIVDIVEPLRAGNAANLTVTYNELIAERDSLVKLLGSVE